MSATTPANPTPPPAAAELAAAVAAAEPYWIEFCRGRTDDAANATTRVWIAIQVVLGNNPKPVTNTQTLTTVTDGKATDTRTYQITHAVWCPTPTFPARAGGTCPTCGAAARDVTPPRPGS